MYTPRTYEIRGPNGESYYDAPLLTQMLGDWIQTGWRYYAINPYTNEIVSKGYIRSGNAKRAAEKWALAYDKDHEDAV